jgi:hypothetical protein
MSSILSISKRNFSFFGNNPQGNPQSKLGGPSYQSMAKTLTVLANPQNFGYWRQSSRPIPAIVVEQFLQWTPHDFDHK